MKLFKVSNYDQASQKAAKLIAAQIQAKPDSVIGLPTGSTPVGAYAILVDMHKRGELDFSKVTTCNLDEYRGIASDDPQSYRYFMDEHLFNHVNIPKENIRFPDQESPEKYDEQIAAMGGLDFMFLGIGNNGHIGFNEPGSYFPAETRCAPLSENTIEANARFFDSPDDVPREAVTMGIKTIMLAEKIILVSSGEAKREATHQAIYGPITPELPGSILQVHRDVTIIWNEQ